MRGLIMVALIVVVLAVAIAAILLWFWQQYAGGSRRASSAAQKQRSLFTLRIGDIVEYLGEYWVVEGKLTYDEGGWIWQEYMLQDGDRLRWLAVEEDDLVEVSWLEPVETLDLVGEPSDYLRFEDRDYRLIDSGTATMTREGNIQRRAAERCRFFDYKGDGDRVLSIEDWDGEIEVTAGRQIRPSELTFLPREEGSVYQDL